jgi:hypothetical protein
MHQGEMVTDADNLKWIARKLCDHAKYVPFICVCVCAVGFYFTAFAQQEPTLTIILLYLFHRACGSSDNLACIVVDLHDSQSKSSSFFNPF